ncbi:MAG: DUF1501 domain-containing protein [Pirellulales bacterium]
MNLHHCAEVAVGRQGQVQRRDFLRGVSAAALAAGTLSWTDVVTFSAEDLRRRGKACILLWMQGAPSQFETFNPKPGHANGGETKSIATSVPGIEIAESLPNIARGMEDMAIIRSMTSKEGNHQRATFLLHTGYFPTASVKHPTLGALVASELGDPQSELPSFVRIGNNFRNTGGGGLLGVDYDAFQLQNADTLPTNTTTATTPDRFRRRLGLLDRLESQYAAQEGKQEVADHKKLYSKTARMILSPRMEAFDIARESDSTRDAYGRKPFGTSCLLARRLIESGVTFVEVSLGNWDTHDSNFDRCKSLCGQIDQPVAALVQDLKDRGMLDDTLIVWMGEFGRTPRINPRAGRDHYPKAFNAMLAGGGIRGGQVVGSTDAGGTDVSDRPVSVQDLLQTVCKSLAINPAKENMSSIGRPIKIVDGGQPVQELFG